MVEQFLRTELLLGEKAMAILEKSRVAVFGIGGVGGYVVEALARSGIGYLDIIDNDTVNLTNLNRQIIATYDTLGCYKVDVMKERIKNINAKCTVNTYQCFYLPESAHLFNFEAYDYVVDAIDTVTGKIQLVVEAERVGTPIISSMGTGNKLNPTQLEVSDIYKTSVCPLARVMRKELKKRHIKHLKVVYSKEQPIKVIENEGLQEELAHTEKRSIPGSTAFVPSVAGLIIASEVIKDLTKFRDKA